MAEIVLNVEVREQTGTGGARATRRAGMVPGVLYGGDKDPVAIAVKSNEFRKALYTGKLLGHLVTLKYGKETQPVIAKAVDMHPVTDEPLHFDLYRVDAHQQIKIDVPVHFTNQEASPGPEARRRAERRPARRSTVACHADQIPEEIVVDLTGLDIGDAIRVSDLEAAGQGVTAAIDARPRRRHRSPAAKAADGREPREGEAADGAGRGDGEAATVLAVRSGFRGRRDAAHRRPGQPRPDLREEPPQHRLHGRGRDRAPLGLPRGAFAFPGLVSRGRDRHARTARCAP